MAAFAPSFFTFESVKAFQKAGNGAGLFAEKRDSVFAKSGNPVARRNRTFKCLKCKDTERFFGSSARLTLHLKLHGRPPAVRDTAARDKRVASVGAFVCGKCNDGFDSQDGLVTHIFRYHTDHRGRRIMRDGEEPMFSVAHRCDEPGCGMTFGTAGILNRHRATHSDDRGHKCAKCGMGFALKDGLDRHVHSVHSEVRHTCGCGKSYNRKDNYKRHKRECPQAERV